MWSVFKKQREIRISQKYYLIAQNKWAIKMGALTSNLSKKSLIFFLILFVVITGTIFIYNACKGFLSMNSSLVKVDIISNVSYLNKKPTLKKDVQIVLSKTEIENFAHFRFYLDSLKESAKGIRIYDSINYYRPGLLDSLVLIENYYRTNLKK